MNGFIYIIRNTVDDREIYYIDLYDSINKSKGYNVSIGGKTPRFLRKVISISTLVDLKACIYNNIEYNSSTSAQHLKEDENVC